jgi:2-oxoglutarate dehydrogenase E2 component (dihydrolipoamide succinyltransferase)
MIVGLAGALPAIYFLGPKPKSEVVGSLQFEGLRDLSDDRRDQFVKEQREWLAQPRFRDQARELLLTKQSGVSAGFLGNDEQAVGEYMGIVEKTHVKEGTNSLTLPYRGTDREGDRARMDALVTTLYTQNQPLQDAARSTQGKASEGERQLQALAGDIEKAKQRAAQLREKAEAVPALEKKLQALQAEDERLSRAAEDARREVIRLRAELGRAQSRGAIHLPGGAVVSLASLLLVPAPAEGVIEAAPATQPAPDEVDVQLREWREQLERVETSIAAARAKSVRREPAPGALAPRRPEASRNPAIRRMEQELALKQRFRNAAQGGGLAEDAARIEREVAALSARLAVGRELVAAGLAGTDDASLQKRIDERLAAAAGQDVEVHALPGEAVGSPAAGPTTGSAVAELENEAADLRAKIAARGAELAAAPEKAAAPAEAVALLDAAAPEPAPQAPAAPAPADDKVRAELAAAQQRQDEATAAATRSGEAVRQARLDLDDARRAASDVARAMADWQKLEADRRDLLRRVESLKATLAASVVPVKPGADAVTDSAVGEDRRFLWMLVAGASIVAVCSLMMWVSAHGAQSLAIPDRENPFEAPVVGAAPPAGGDDDERPLAV